MMRRALVFLCTAAATAAAEPRKLTVDDAVTLALRQNPRLLAVEERVHAARAVAHSARGRLGFSIHASEEYQHWDSPFQISFKSFAGGGGGMVPFPEGTPDGYKPIILATLATLANSPPVNARDQDTNTFALTAAQPLLGLLRNGYDWQAQERAADAADAGQRVALAAVREAIRAGFLRYFEARAMEQIAAASVGELDEQVRVAQVRLKAGVLTNADVLRVQVAEANARQQQILAHTQAQTAHAQLLNAIGLDPADDTVELVEPTELLQAGAAEPPASAEATHQAEAKRPEVLQASLLLKSAQNTRRARAFSLLPDIDLEGGYVRIDGQLFAPHDQWYVGLRANWQVWEWGATFYQERAATHQAQAAALDLDGQRRQVATEVQVNLEQTTAARAAVDVAQQAIASAEEAYRVTNALVQAGSATTTDLLDAQAALTTARLNLARAQYERAIARVALERTLGD